MNSYRLIHQIRCTIFFEQHAEQTYTAEEIIRYCGMRMCVVRHVLDDLCKMNILESLQDERTIVYRYVIPENQRYLSGLI